MIADTLSRLINIDPDIILEPECKRIMSLVHTALKPCLKQGVHPLQKNWPQLTV